MASGTKRTQREYNDIQKKKPSYVLNVELVNDELDNWCITFEGPSGSPYEGGKFQLKIKIPNEYPFKPPTLSFGNQVYHPNVKQPENSMCFDMITQEQWSPQLKIVNILEEVYELFKKPNPNNPLDPVAAELYVKNVDEFNKNAKEATKKHAH